MTENITVVEIISTGTREWLTPRADGLYHTPASRGSGELTMKGLVDTL